MTDELLNATVSVRGVVFSEANDVLILKRSSDQEWELPGGRLGPDESVLDGLRRELREETRFEVEPTAIVHANTWRNDVDNGRFAVYYLCITDRQPVQLSAEHIDSKWIPYSEATTTLSQPQTTAVHQAYQHRTVAESNPPISGN